LKKKRKRKEMLFLGEQVLEGKIHF
jgi:hypothetical protein